MVWVTVRVRIRTWSHEKYNQYDRCEVTQILMSEPGVGPTTAKMFLVSTHLRYPEYHLADLTCEVGDGAAAAVAYLFPDKPIKTSEDREWLLASLLREMNTRVDVWDNRFKSMLAWTSQRAASVFGGTILKELFSENLTAFELQVPSINVST